MSFRIVIPARYQATRLPGKPLRDLAGKPLIQHVHERAVESGAETIIIATDDERIRAAAEGFGAMVCMTRSDHRNGTERLGEVIEKMAWPDEAVIVNLQGDEPLMPPDCLRQVAQLLEAHPDCAMATLYAEIDDPEDIFDPHVVKLVANRNDEALYFSRAAIPWWREVFNDAPQVELADPPTAVKRHIGLYAYRAGFGRGYASLQASPLEQMESLEQLRALWHGYRIAVAEAVELPPAGVDTEGDLERVRRQLASQSAG